ncbi:hypothetical protein DBP12_03260 [Streptomyces sp. CS014]|nr:hypothetical protein DBP12_03260 [Streptomyces sp. CS014]
MHLRLLNTAEKMAKAAEETLDARNDPLIDMKDPSLIGLSRVPRYIEVAAATIRSVLGEHPQELRLTGPQGGPISITAQQAASLTPDQRRAAILALAEEALRRQTLAEAEHHLLPPGAGGDA